MTRRQKQLLAVGAALFLLMELFPPWSYEFPPTTDIESAGYHFRFSPPPAKPFEDVLLSVVCIASLQLLAQRLVVAFLIIGLMIWLKKSPSPVSQVIGGLFLCVGFIGLLFFLYMFII